ncbi:quinolinate synthase NadA [Mahella australiensis]|uniref:Quinolinate synthase n=1 Tax=Mahella australiensis (strain DSM 15567 / CIP 107919 / 50-1 BON) TaxID=697281 RepID=F3ZVH8_MAHA5|nr:quinolinate synthase NadA [Mahella australiensis]AEE96340.1 quinolinate synthetase A [Mahella australiensis 50-1 BON]
MDETVSRRISVLKKERNAIILAHFYQRPEVQDIADFVGDSLELARKASVTDADVIVFCGVHFMAQTAYILSPDKSVLLPQIKAGCPMADTADADDVAALKEQHPDAVVVSYVNTTAEVKAISDICCTSANAVKVVNSIPANKEIIFIPDKNLGQYIMEQTGRHLILWSGYCNTHDRLTAEELLAAKRLHPEAEVLAHPECRPDVVHMADFVGSTGGMVMHVRDSHATEFIIGTEIGVIHRMKQLCSNKSFYPASQKLMCPNMKLTSLDDVLKALETVSPRVTVNDYIRSRALLPIERMLAL